MPISAKTVQRIVARNHISDRLSDAKLYSEIDRLQKANDTLAALGGRMTASKLRIEGYAVYEARVVAAQKELNPVEAEARKRKAAPVPERIEYLSLGPCDYWHCDQHEKIFVGAFKIILYDGFSGKVLSLVALPSKNSRLVFAASWWKAVKEYGLPAGVRLDKGTDAVIIVFSQLSQKLKVTTGKSTDNGKVCSCPPRMLCLFLLRLRRSGLRLVSLSQLCGGLSWRSLSSLASIRPICATALQCSGSLFRLFRSTLTSGAWPTIELSSGAATSLLTGISLLLAHRRHQLRLQSSLPLR